MVSSPAFNKTDDTLHGISADTGDDVWTAGDSGDGLILRFDRTSWIRKVLPDPSQGFIGLFADTAPSPTDVWEVRIVQGNDRCCPHAAIEHRNGTGWGAVSSPDPNPNATLSLTAITAISASDIRTAGFAIEDWDGTSWSIVSSPAFGQLEEVAAHRDGPSWRSAIRASSWRIDRRRHPERPGAT